MREATTVMRVDQFCWFQQEKKAVFSLVWLRKRKGVLKCSLFDPRQTDRRITLKGSQGLNKELNW